MTKNRRKWTRRSGSAMIEFTFVGIPLLFVLISVFEMARGMWLYHTLAYAAKEGTRFACVRGLNCATAPNSCSVTVADIANRIQYHAIGLLPDELNVTLQVTSASGTAVLSSVSCNPLSSCLSNTTVFPPDKLNVPELNDVLVDARYPFRSAIALFWPGNRGVGPFPVISFRSLSRAQIEF